MVGSDSCRLSPNFHQDFRFYYDQYLMVTVHLSYGFPFQPVLYFRIFLPELILLFFDLILMTMDLEQLQKEFPRALADTFDLQLQKLLALKL